MIRWAAEACVALTEGEILQGRFRRNPAVTVADYVEIIDRKTSSLFAAGARTAAHLAGAPPDVVDAMRGVRHPRRPRVPDAGRPPRRRGHERAHRQAARASTSATAIPRCRSFWRSSHDPEVRRIFALEAPDAGRRRDGPRPHPPHGRLPDDRRPGRRRARDRRRRDRHAAPVRRAIALDVLAQTLGEPASYRNQRSPRDPRLARSARGAYAPCLAMGVALAAAAPRCRAPLHFVH